MISSIQGKQHLNEKVIIEGILNLSSSSHLKLIYKASRKEYYHWKIQVNLKALISHLIIKKNLVKNRVLLWI
jgi:hypothetical protein